MTGNSDAVYSAAIEKVDSVERAIELLESKELIPGGQPMSLLIIRDSLLHLTRAAAPAATTVECLVAFSRIADTVDMELITSEVANQVCHKTMAAYNILDDGVDKLEQPRIELEGCVNRVKEQIRWGGSAWHSSGSADTAALTHRPPGPLIGAKPLWAPIHLFSALASRPALRLSLPTLRFRLRRSSTPSTVCDTYSKLGTVFPMPRA
ncbi:predicted protein [Postia placenta Mad-698-R]|uniref:Uncharacterized protein n=1 Tax=Postia placenta MAD-698-R-SB12 TaxID=670580 RepID=A0A1X6MK91_9APHY|nr:hypothetical protein POSPLADRAFT_1158560 [Postia placenta MAD-698-R-SB12]EED84028.1 predicted protein [Postia placenta Mad-698-R]OSX56804.1 hypothetical protein POSPLADRAFT_1158560 [Postia placenta MAD-698-R-SB12]